MNFFEAMKCVLEGETVCLDDFVISKDTLYRLSNLSFNYFDSNDWQIYKPLKTPRDKKEKSMNFLEAIKAYEEGYSVFAGDGDFESFLKYIDDGNRYILRVTSKTNSWMPYDYEINKNFLLSENWRIKKRKNMEFAEAADLFKRGFNIKRASWTDKYLSQKTSEINLVSVEDILATDWEEI